MSVIGEVAVISCQYEWNINNFFSYTVEGTVYRSPQFTTSNLRWFIKIYPHGQTTTNSTGYISLYLMTDSVSTNVYPLSINFNLGIKSAKQIILHRKRVNHTYDKSESYGWHKFISRSELLDRKAELVPSDILTIVCYIEVKDTAPVLNSEYTKLSEDFKTIYTSEENSDVKLNVNNEASEKSRKRSKTEYETYPAHKIILSARSPVFAAMFTHETEENKTGIVNIPDCDPDAFEIFLIFLYSGNVDFEKCNACELYKISDKYDASDLKLLCSDFLTKNMSTENFVENVMLSNQFNDTKLLTETQQFFNKNFEKIVTSDKWESFIIENPSVANELLKGMAPRVKIV